MRPTVTTRLLLVLALVATAVGFVDSAVGRQWDTVAVFGIVILLVGAVLARVQSRRPPMPLRRDLADWLRERAAATGEDPEVVADRAVAAYRSGLTGWHGAEAGGR